MDVDEFIDGDSVFADVVERLDELGPVSISRTWEML